MVSFVSKHYFEVSVKSLFQLCLNFQLEDCGGVSLNKDDV